MSTDTTDAERESFLASIKTKIDAGGITQPELDLIVWYGKARFGISVEPRASEKSTDFSRIQTAVEWLRNALAGGPREAAELKDAAKDALITPSILRAADERLGVRHEKLFHCGRGSWYWLLPESATSKNPAA